MEIAKTKDDPDLPRGWSRYTAGTSAYNTLHGITPERPERVAKKEYVRQDDVKAKFVSALSASGILAR